MSIFEELQARERIRVTMETDLAKQLEAVGDDDHYHIMHLNVPVEHWVDSVMVQVILKCDLLKKRPGEHLLPLRIL